MGKKGESRRRLERAAFDLYREGRYRDVTAAQIAAQAGLTERTFFRYFGDKREMLFSGGSEMQDLASAAIQSSAAGSAFEIAILGLHAVVPVFENHYELACERARIIDTNTDLQERELFKRKALTDAISSALRSTGIPESTADLTAALAGVVFHDAFTHWLKRPGLNLRTLIDASAGHMKEIAGR